MKKVTDIVAEIASASQEQSHGIDQVNQAVTQMDQVVQSNAAQTEELSSTAQMLASQSGDMHRLVGRFKLGTAGAAAEGPTRRPVTVEPGVIVGGKRAPAPRMPAMASAPRNGGGLHDEAEEF